MHAHPARICTLVLTLAVLVIVGRAGEAREPAPPRNRALNAKLREVTAIREAESVVVARVKKVLESPGIWCGFLMTHQDVVWTVIETVYGKPVGEEVRVGHLLVHGSGLVAKDSPHLRPDLIYPGARAILMLNRREKIWVVRDEGYGVRLVDPPRKANAAHADVLRLLLDLSALQPYLHPEVEGRVPVTVRLNEAVPLPLAVEKFGTPVRFEPPEIAKRGPHLVVGTLRVDAQEAYVGFGYPAEGIVGEAKWRRGQDGWDLIGSSIAEK